MTDGDKAPVPAKPSEAKSTEFNADIAQNWRGSAILDTVTLEEGVCMSDNADTLSDKYRLLTFNINGRHVEIYVPAKVPAYTPDRRWLSPYAYRCRTGNVLRWERFDGRGRTPGGVLGGEHAYR